MKNWIQLLFDSWSDQEGFINSNQDIDKWINDLNHNIHVDIQRNCLSDSTYWFYDDKKGIITNKNNSFFFVQGIQRIKDNKVVYEQPIIMQNEIGFLGIICSIIDGKLHFLMQAKIEPGNINKIQISPTIQATKSNFTQKHGGKKPKYLEYFTDVDACHIIVDQIQSEQSSRFYHKRNRNIIIMIDKDIKVEDNFKWMTLGQIKRLMRFDNIVNMDTRTVLSCLPIYNSLSLKEREEIICQTKDQELSKSILDFDHLCFSDVFHKINDIKMFEETSLKFVPLHELTTWKISDDEICNDTANFKVIYCDISIEGREVTHWTQPLFQATGIALFGLITKVFDGKKKFLVKLKKEIGCFDNVELGPTIQREANELNEVCDCVEKIFFEHLEQHKNVQIDVLLSEEGGRFYHEQNRNIIINIEDDIELTDEYIWLDFATLNQLIQFNNVCNIQLRNLISLLEV